MANKKSIRYLALLRGINVGGKNIIAKDDLRKCFEDLGMCNVRTYIQSGNILFRSEETSVKRLIPKIERGLSQRFNYQAHAVVLSHQKYKSAVAAAPEGWGFDESQKHNALFTLAGKSPAKLVASLPDLKPDIEALAIGPGVIFWSVSKDHLSKASMMKIASLPAYQDVTVRNHNTVFKLLELFESI